jgi:hypothetical protein
MGMGWKPRSFAPASLLLVLVATASAGQAQTAWPAAAGISFPGCRDLWIIDASRAPTTAPFATDCLQCQHLDPLRGWTPIPWHVFAQQADPALPTTFYVHGYGLGMAGATVGADRLADSLDPHVPPFRLVIWVWPARHRLLAGPAANVADKGRNAEAQGFYLASVLQRMPAESRVTLVGHSFGAQSVLSALEGLAVGHAAGQYLPLAGAAGPRRIQTALLAPSVPNTSLSAGGRYSHALSQTERLVATVNGDDGVLLLLGRVQNNYHILGLTGPAGPTPDGKVFVMYTAGYLGRRHRVSHFAWSGPIVAGLLPYLVYAN